MRTGEAAVVVERKLPTMYAPRVEGRDGARSTNGLVSLQKKEV